MIQMNQAVETSEIVAFVRVVDAKSFSRAAAELKVPRATLGRRMTRLEHRLGARLLRRTTRSLSLTDAGQTFYRHARIVLDAVARAEASVRREDNVMRGDVRVSVPPMPSDAQASFSGMIIAFATEHPEVRLQIDMSTRLVDLVRDGYDVALRATGDLQPGLVARTVRTHRVIAVASPAYLAERGVPRTAKDLRRHRCLTGFARGELPTAAWPVGRGILHVESVFSTNDLPLLRDAAIAGLGVALLPELVASEPVAAGKLVHVLRGIVEAQNKLAVVYPERELMLPHVRAFIDALLRWTSIQNDMAGPPRRNKRRAP